MSETRDTALEAAIAKNMVFGEVSDDPNGISAGLDFSGVKKETEEPKKEEIKTEELDKKDEAVINKESSLHNESATETKVEEAKVQSFEDLLSERSEGKFKVWDDVKAILDAPKQEFSNEYVSKFNEFSKNFDNPKEALDVFVKTQTVDYKSMTDPIGLIGEELSNKHPELSAEDIKTMIEADYRIDEWSDEGEEPTKVEKAMKVKMKLDAESSRKNLIATQEKWLVTPEKKQAIDPEAIKKEQEAFVEQVNEAAKGISKISSDISDKEKFDYVISDDDSKAMRKMVKNLSTNASALFLDDKGKFDNNKFITGVYKMLNYDKAIKFAYEQARAKGAETIVKDIKNIKMENDSKSTEAAPESMSVQLGRQILARNKGL